ncbi:MAG: hypothetical protein IJ890_05530 [Clostridia bacterium]|nr:hypothetical protein [Clostridia bacterium]
MEEYINVTNFNVNNIEAGKLYTLYYELTDEELNNKEKLGNIINNLWDNFIYNPTLDSNIHLDRQEKIITITTKLKDNLIFKTVTDGLKSSVNILGQAVTNIVKNIINKEPIAVTFMPLTTKEAIAQYQDYANTGNTIIQTLTENPVIATVVDTTGNVVNAVNDTFKNTAKTLPYLPYILLGVGIVILLSYGNLSNVTKLFKGNKNE